MDCDLGSLQDAADKVLTRLFFDQKKALQSLGFQPKIFCLVSMSMTEEIVI